jgi:hypothetical protein
MLKNGWEDQLFKIPIPKLRDLPQKTSPNLYYFDKNLNIYKMVGWRELIVVTIGIGGLRDWVLSIRVLGD